MLLATMALGLTAGVARAQDKYPSRPIRLVVSFPPGGPLDVMARLYAQRLSMTFGQMIVDNKPGAGGTLAGREVARAAADGYTLMFGSSATLAIGPSLYKDGGYDPVKSFAPIALFSNVPYVMIGATNAPFRTVSELLAYARANPGALNFGVPNGAPPHMLAEMFKARTGAAVQVVPYRGASTLITDMLAGRIHAGFETTSVMFGHLHDGKIRGLAVLREARLPEIPDVPTMIEQGVTGVQGSSWSGVLAPAGTPPEIIARLNSETIAAIRSPEVADKLKLMAAETRSTTPEEFGAFVANEYQRIGAIMRNVSVQTQ
jgi:tripartite-type tricarboxylate transporter receptor subunit TctC